MCLVFSATVGILTRPCTYLLPAYLGLSVEPGNAVRRSQNTLLHVVALLLLTICTNKLVLFVSSVDAASSRLSFREASTSARVSALSPAWRHPVQEGQAAACDGDAAAGPGAQEGAAVRQLGGRRLPAAPLPGGVWRALGRAVRGAAAEFAPPHPAGAQQGDFSENPLAASIACLSPVCEGRDDSLQNKCSSAHMPPQPHIHTACALLVDVCEN